MPVTDEEREQATEWVQRKLAYCCQGDTSGAIASEIVGNLYDVVGFRINPTLAFDQAVRDIQKIVKEPEERNYGADHFLERNSENLSREIVTLLVNEYGLERIPQGVV